MSSKIIMWLKSCRPKTLLLSLIAILMGISLAYFCGVFRLNVVVLTLLTAMLLQILCNFANDYGDAQNGADDENRLGPLRGIQSGEIALQTFKKALFFMTFLCLISGLTLIFVACNTWRERMLFIVLGFLALIAAITYTISPKKTRKPYGYIGLGDLSVFIFFGLISVIGAFYLQTLQLNYIALLPAIACGLFSSAVLNINNLRDFDTDKKCGKQTLAVKLGEQNARYYHAALILGAFFCLIFFAVIYTTHWQSWLFILALPLIFKHLHYVLTHLSSNEMIPMFANVVQIALFTMILFCFGLLLH